MSRPALSTPLVLDLDGTVIQTDLLGESLLGYLRLHPFGVFQVALWVLAGRAALKRELARAGPVDIESLPLREDIVAYARAQAEGGRRVVLATAADETLARRVADRLGFIDQVIASDGLRNLKGANKAKALREAFPGGFAYAGDAEADLAVWREADEIIFAGASLRLLARCQALGKLVTALPAPKANARCWIKALRLHQWAKNALIFPPLFLGGAILSPHAWIACGLGFLAMGLMASATYVVNDLLDLPDDRRHWTKRERPFASGRLSILAGLPIPPLGVLAGFGLAYLAGGGPGVGMLAIYLVTTLAYSFRLKRVPILDVVVLAGLFTLRLAIGVVCAQVIWSSWLLVFSMFLFGSLSFAKRLTELLRVKARGGERLSGRGYLAADEPLVLAFGAALASAAVFTLVMYLIEEAFRADFYRAPGFLWTLPVILALWLGRIWLLCGRGQLDDDPVVFAVRDPQSLVMGAALALAMLAAVLA